MTTPHPDLRCAQCEKTPETYARWHIDRTTGAKRVLCYPCSRVGYVFDDDGAVVATWTPDDRRMGRRR